jgi:CRP-like cAMP-binding protein
MTQSRTAQDVLAEVDLFKGLSSRHLSKVAKLAREVEHRPGQEVASEGHGGYAFQVVVSGQADVSVHGEHKRTLGPGDYFGEISLIDGKPRSATVTASGTEPLRTLAIDSTAFDRLLEEEPSVSHHLLVLFCERLRAFESNR